MASQDIRARQQAKQAAARMAVSFIQEGMLVGLGTGSTAEYFIEALGERCRQGLQIQAAATSQRSAELAHRQSIPLAAIDTLLTLDVDVDGADAITASKTMIKGG